MHDSMCLTYREAEPQVEVIKFEANVHVRLRTGDFDLAVSEYHSFGDLLEERAHDVLKSWGEIIRVPEEVKVREYEPVRVEGDVTVFRVRVEVINIY